MISPFVRFVRISLALALVLPFVAAASTWVLGGGQVVAAFWVPMAALGLLSLAAALWIGAKIGRLDRVLETLGEAQARFLDELPGSRVPLAIVVSAGASLFLELAIIRWHGTEWEVFAFYKNFSLLGCFLGLGLGYALAGQPRIPAVAVLPLLAFEVAYLLVLRHAVPGTGF